jgi:hypothetical protein
MRLCATVIEIEAAQVMRLADRLKIKTEIMRLPNINWSVYLDSPASSDGRAKW